MKTIVKICSCINNINDSKIKNLLLSFDNTEHISFINFLFLFVEKFNNEISFNPTFFEVLNNMLYLVCKDDQFANDFYDTKIYFTQETRNANDVEILIHYFE